MKLHPTNINQKYLIFQYESSVGGHFQSCEQQIKHTEHLIVHVPGSCPNTSLNTDEPVNKAHVIFEPKIICNSDLCC